MTASTTRRNYFILMISVIGTVAAAPCPASDSNQPAATIDTNRALQSEFSQAGEALRERLDREAAGDWLGAARAAQSVAKHRARFLILKRQFAQDSPSQSTASAARDNPFLADARFAATKTATAIEDSDRLNDSGDEHRLRTAATALAAWDMYRSAASVSEPSMAGNAPDPAPTTSFAKLERTWGMYSRATRRPKMNGSSPRRRSDAEDHREAPEQPFLVYRDPMAEAR
jgi:hypothetical protein